jgi:hypothetical protein
MIKLGRGVCLQNVLLQTKPGDVHVGCAATVIFARDLHGATVIKVTPKTVTVQIDKAIRTDTNGMSDQQSYIFERNPKGAIYRFWKTKWGWSARGMGLRIGDREEFYDYTF